MRERAIGYVRVSTAEQANEGVSIDAQHAKLRAYAAFKDLDLEILTDAGVSASRPLSERPEGSKVVSRTRPTGDVKIVVACKLDRLFRDAADCLAQTRRWDSAGVAIHFLDMGVDTSTPMGRAFLTMAAAFAELERNLIAERTRTGLAQVRGEGGRIGRAPYGYERTGETDAHGRQTFRRVEAEHAILDRMRSLRGLGMSFAAIADCLNREDVPTKGGGRAWHGSTVNAILSTCDDVEIRTGG